MAFFNFLLHNVYVSTFIAFKLKYVIHLHCILAPRAENIKHSDIVLSKLSVTTYTALSVYRHSTQSTEET